MQQRDGIFKRLVTSSPVVLQPPHVRGLSAGEWLARPDTGVGFLAAPVGRSDRDHTIAPPAEKPRTVEDYSEAREYAFRPRIVHHGLERRSK
jgi:hypothetical protein